MPTCVSGQSMVTVVNFRSTKYCTCNKTTTALHLLLTMKPLVTSGDLVDPTASLPSRIQLPSPSSCGCHIVQWSTSRKTPGPAAIGPAAIGPAAIVAAAAPPGQTTECSNESSNSTISEVDQELPEPHGGVREPEEQRPKDLLSALLCRVLALVCLCRLCSVPACLSGSDVLRRSAPSCRLSPVCACRVLVLPALW